MVDDSVGNLLSTTSDRTSIEKQLNISSFEILSKEFLGTKAPFIEPK